MAKRKDATTPADHATKRSASAAQETLEERVVIFAEQLGRIVGTVQAKADGWLDRQTLNDQLTRIRDGATDLLNHLGSGTAAAAVAATPARTQTMGGGQGHSATATTADRAIAETSRSGGKVDAPGKTHRKPPERDRGIKHSDEMVSKLKAAQTMRRGRRRG